MLGIMLLPGLAARAATSSLASAVPDEAQATAIATADAEVLKVFLEIIGSLLLGAASIPKAWNQTAHAALG
jgi:hypothetical protein